MHLTGGFNPARIAVESSLEYVERFGLELGNSCDEGFSGDSTFSFIHAEGLVTPTPLPTPECKDFTPDDYRNANKAVIKRFDDHPQDVDIWLSLDSLLPERIEFSVPNELLRSPANNDFSSGSQQLSRAT